MFKCLFVEHSALNVKRKHFAYPNILKISRNFIVGLQLYSRLYRQPTTAFSNSFVFRGFWQATDNSFEFSKEFLTDFQYNME